MERTRGRKSLRAVAPERQETPASPPSRTTNSEILASPPAGAGALDRPDSHCGGLCLRTLGGLSLETGGRPIIGAGGQPMRLAILCVIAAGGERGASRDRLLSLFWPESDTEHARGALKQALYALRRDAGEQGLLLGTAAPRLNPAVIRCDAAEFERAAAGGELDAAVRLYGGPFLDGVHLGAAAEFDQWVELERDRLARCFGMVLEALARGATARGEHATAVGWWRRLATADPLNSRVAMGLVQALADAGDLAGALLHAGRHEAALRAELDLPPDPALTKLMDELRDPPARRPEPRVSVAAGGAAPVEAARPAAPVPCAAPAAGVPAEPAGIRRPARARGARRPVRRGIVITLLAAGLAIAALTSRAMLGDLRRALSPARRSVLALPLPEPVVDAPGLTFALSPDGTAFAYVGRTAAGQQLFVRDMDTMDGVALSGTEGASTPFFSPDGAWIGFVAGGRLRKVPVHGGPIQTLCDAPGIVLGASWANDSIIFAPSASSGLMQVPAAGGAPVPLTAPDTANGETSHRWPQVLPGGTEVLFTSWSGDLATAQAAVLDLTTGLIHRLGPGIGARYSTSGHIVFATADGRLLARPFNPATRQETGDTIEVLSGVRLDGGPAFAVGPRGLLIYTPARASQRAVEWLDRSGRSTVVIGAPGVYSDPRLSPDGSRLALTIRRDGDADVWVYAFATRSLTRLTRGAENLYPAWAPDGRSITFASTRRGGLDLYRVAADGRGEPTLLWSGPGDDVPDSWAPDGRTLFFRTTEPATSRDIWALRVDGGRRRGQPVIETEADERSAMISPDGRWLAYTSSRSGVSQVYVLDWPRASTVRQVSTGSGAEPLWARDGRELFYRAGDSLIAVEVATKPGFRVLSRAVLFESPFAANGFRTNYDVAPDGRRFIAIRSGEAPAQLVVLMNWLAPARGD